MLRRDAGPARPGDPPAAPPLVGRRRATADAPLPGLSRSRAFIPELESLRGIAVLQVLLFHVDGFAAFPAAVSRDVSIPLALVRGGNAGVDLFFLLSAFLLSAPFLADVAGGKRVVIGDYVARRALRILPLYWTAVLVGTWLSATTYAGLLAALPYLAFLNVIPSLTTPLYPYSAVWWSLATEAQFYLLLPLLLVLRSALGRLLAAAGLVAYALAYVALVRGHIILPSIGAQLSLHDSVFGRGPVFLCGIAAAELYRRFGPALRDRLAARRWVANGGADVVLWASIVAYGVLLRGVVALGPIGVRSAEALPWHFIGALLCAGIVLLLLLAPLWTKALFVNPVLRRLGIVSYSIYMLHVPFVFIALITIRGGHPGQYEGWSAPGAALVTLVTLACIGVAEVTFRLIERPFLARKARFDS